jgi:putative membrane protein
MPNEEEQKLPEEMRAKHETEYLANERTFLAWVRTSIGVISLGFVVARFSIWIKEMAARMNPSGVEKQHPGASLPMGEIMIALGALLPILAAWRYHVVNKAIESGRIKADRALVFAITVLISLLGTLMVIYLVATANR